MISTHDLLLQEGRKMYEKATMPVLNEAGNTFDLDAFYQWLSIKSKKDAMRIMDYLKIGIFDYAYDVFDLIPKYFNPTVTYIFNNVMYEFEWRLKLMPCNTFEFGYYVTLASHLDKEEGEFTDSWVNPFLNTWNNSLIKFEEISTTTRLRTCLQHMYAFLVNNEIVK